MNYIHLWTSLIECDMKKVEKFSKKLGSAELYPLFVSMLTFREFSDVSSNKIAVAPTDDELDKISDNAAKYITEITEVLSKVDRELLLLFKTNDTVCLFLFLFFF